MSNVSTYVENPSVDITVNFLPHQEKICYECYHEVCNIYESLLSEKNETHHVFDSDGVDFCSEGWYFNIYISLKETELIKKIVEKISEYKYEN